jgi:Raf kinase inhibitor-like YbhB/YbcL family protein
VTKSHATTGLVPRAAAFEIESKVAQTTRFSNSQIRESLALFLVYQLFFILVNPTTAAPSIAARNQEKRSMEITSPSFKNGDRIERQFTADGVNQSPSLQWSNVPPASKSLALICDDPDAPMGTWVHWVVYNMPPDLSGLDQAIPPEKTLRKGGTHGTNSFHKLGYGGPSPPPGKPHRYFFKLFALDKMLALPAGADAKALGSAMNGHILAQAQLMGIYGR